MTDTLAVAKHTVTKISMASQGYHGSKLKSNSCTNKECPISTVGHKPISVTGNFFELVLPMKYWLMHHIRGTHTASHRLNYNTTISPSKTHPSFLVQMPMYWGSEPDHRHRMGLTGFLYQPDKRLKSTSP